MSEILNNSIKVIVSFFIVLFINKALSIFRKRQLYLSCWNYLKNTSLSDNSCTINGSIYNKGKDKEKNVEISMPSGIKMSLVSSDYSSIKTENGKIIIDRVLPSQKVSIIALIEGVTEVNSKLKPEIKSEDANGKTFLSQDSVPPSMGIIVLGMTCLLFISGAFIYIEKVDNNAIFYIENKYNHFKYDALYEQGFSLAIYQSKKGADRFTLKNSTLPVSLLDITKANEYIIYSFELFNPTNEKVDVDVRFAVDDAIGYSNDLSKAHKNRPEENTALDSQEWDDYFNGIKSTYDKHNVEYVLKEAGGKLLPMTSNESGFILTPQSHKIITMKRKVKKTLKPNEYNVNLDFSIDRNSKDGYLDLIFNPNDSHKKDVFEEIKRNSN